jgi:hypothetical protein
MKTTIEVLGKRFLLESRLVNSGVPFGGWFNKNDDKDQTLHNAFNISVCRRLDSGGKISRNFTFYDSQHNYEEGKEDLEADDLKEAFRCFIGDAQAAVGGFPDFCSEFGYDQDSRRSYRMFKACERSMEKVQDLGINLNELCDVLNALSEQGIE